ncbi:DUF4244 domain-containing protein [Kitasatospora purpeofusca]|uniref:DUF4244 domain-containing protein n=1 Tax=Kitasatospora purpeofusca TaxID=67352 RepID=UPI0039B994E8
MTQVISPVAVAGAEREPAGGGHLPRKLVITNRHSARFVVRLMVRRAVRRRRRIGIGGPDAGMTTSEYAVGTLGACAVAAALYKVATSAAVMDALHAALDRALHAT